MRWIGFVLLGVCTGLAGCATGGGGGGGGGGNENANGNANANVNANANANENVNENANDNTPGPGVVNVAIRDFEFDPHDVTVSVGDTVAWTNAGQVSHTVTSGEPGDEGTPLDSGTLGPGDTYEFTFTEPGEYVYFCGFHTQVPDMVGATVTVE